MPATTLKIRMKFRCDQDINQMLIGEDGKHFCEMCQKSLVDFRQMPLAKVKEYTSKNEVCGIFKSEHVVLEEVIILSFVSIRKYFLAFSTFFMAESAYPQTIGDSSMPIIEKVDSTSNHIKTGETVTCEKDLFVKSAQKNGKKGKVDIEREFQYGVFFSKKFPFISFRRSLYSTGLVCPIDFW